MIEAKLLSFSQKLEQNLIQKISNAGSLNLDKISENLVKKSSNDFQEMSEYMFEQGKKITGNMLQEYLKSLTENESNIFISPETGKTLYAIGKCSRIISTRHGQISYERNYFYDRENKKGYYPLDENLKFAPQKNQYDLQVLAAELLAEMPYERAASIFLKTIGEDISNHCIHEIGERLGAVINEREIIPSKEEIEKIIEMEASKGKWRPVLVVSADGAHLPTRPNYGTRKGKRGPGEWQEAKGFRIYLSSHDKIIHLISWHQICNEEEFGEALKFIATFIPVEKVRVALIGDGAHWLWNRMKESFPTGREILDYYHCSEHIHKLAESQYSNDEITQRNWIESTMAKLYFGEVSSVIWGLKRMNKNSKTSEEEIRKLIVYLENNINRINYDNASRSQMPKGSGGIESANKFICHTRMKRSGAWWYKDNCNKVLKIRCSIANNTFDKMFEEYKAKNSKN